MAYACGHQLGTFTHGLRRLVASRMLPGSPEVPHGWVSDSREAELAARRPVAFSSPRGPRDHRGLATDRAQHVGLPAHDDDVIECGWPPGWQQTPRGKGEEASALHAPMIGQPSPYPSVSPAIESKSGRPREATPGFPSLIQPSSAPMPA